MCRFPSPQSESICRPINAHEHLIHEQPNVVVHEQFNVVVNEQFNVIFNEQFNVIFDDQLDVFFNDNNSNNVIQPVIKPKSLRLEYAIISALIALTHKLLMIKNFE